MSERTATTKPDPQAGIPVPAAPPEGAAASAAGAAAGPTAGAGNASGAPPAVVQERPPVDGRVLVKVAQDRLTATVEVYPQEAGGKPVDLETARRALADAGVVHGIDEAALAHAVGTAGGTPVVVARGEPPKEGADAHFLYGFRESAERGRPAELEDGRVDFYNLNLIENVRAGTVLVTKIPPEPGTPGTAVTGEPLPPRPGRDLALLPGKNTELTQDGTRLVASADGQVVLLAKNRVAVYPVYDVKQDVDFTTGNIEFFGAVRVRSSVRDGFRVVAEADIEVGGMVDSATLKAGGNVLVRNGIQGRHKGTVEAGGDVLARFIENATVTAGGNVEVGEAIMHSRVVAGGRVAVGGKKGLLVGGLTRAREEVVCKVLGSSLATATEVEVGVDPKDRTRLDEVLDALIATQRNIERAELAIERLRAVPGRDPTGQREALISRLKASLDGLLAEKQKLMEERTALEMQLARPARGRVRVAQTIFPGVKVTIGSAVMLVRDQLPAATLYLSEAGEIVVGPHA